MTPADAPQYPSLEELFRKGREIAEYSGELWDELSGFERNQYYVRAEQLLLAERNLDAR